MENSMTGLLQVYNLNKKLDAEYRKRTGVTREESKNDDILLFIMELGELTNATKCCKYWSKKLPETREKILTEYVDGLYVLMNFCDYTGLTLEEDYEETPKLELTELIVETTSLVTKLYRVLNQENVKKLLTYYIKIGEFLGFTLGEITGAYISKYKLIDEQL